MIDAAGMIVMPGLVDLHFHTAIGKGYSDHLPLWEYLDAVLVPADPQPGRRVGLLGGRGVLPRGHQVGRDDGE